MTQAEIEKRNSVYVSDLIRTIMSVNVVPSPRGGGHVATSIRGGCALRLILDGVALSTTNLDDLPSPKEIAGIEVYSGPAQIPIQYRDRCGIIRIWTRDGS